MDILLGMSGGVDSCAAVGLLQKEGWTVTGCFLLLSPQSSPDGEEAARAKQAADRMGIRLVTVDCRERFYRTVIRPFCTEYAQGRTPNACVACNPSVKIASIAECADRLGIEKIATGHYARTREKDGVTHLLTGVSDKDQSYFLYRLPQTYLSRLVFPLGTVASKEEVRALALQAGLDAAGVKDSQEICFLPDGHYAEFVKKELGLSGGEGDFVDLQGNRIGRHKGIIHYTAGQRKGLGAFGAPMYVHSIRPQDNTVVLCRAGERFSDCLVTDDPVWCAGVSPIPPSADSAAPSEVLRAQVKIRSAAKAVPAEIRCTSTGTTVRFDTPVMAVTPGQSAVFYDGDYVLGGGIIV